MVVNNRRQLADERHHDGHDARGHQHRDGVVARDGHQRVVLAVVGACAAAQEADDDIIGAIADQVETDQFLDVERLPAHFSGQLVNVQTHLVQVRGGFRDGGDEDQRDAEGQPQARGSVKAGNVTGGMRSQGASVMTL